MARDVSDELLVHYLADECTEQERERVEAWMRADSANRAYLREMERIWDEAGRGAPRNVDAMWEKLANSAVIIGLLALLASALIDRWVDLRTDPYKEIRK